jgi:WD40 repeat protein
LDCLAGKLELLSEKMNAHSGDINSVAFSPDGTKIVSGSDDKTIKVWDSGVCRSPQNRPFSAKTNACWLVLADKLEMLSEKTNAHSGWVGSVPFSPDGTKIVSGSSDGTIKVWDLGALLPSKSPLLGQN